MMQINRIHSVFTSFTSYQNVFTCCNLCGSYEWSPNKQGRYWNAPAPWLVWAYTLTLMVVYAPPHFWRDLRGRNKSASERVTLPFSAPFPDSALVRKWEAASHGSGCGCFWASMRDEGGHGREAALGRFLCDGWTALGGRVARVAQPPRGQHTSWNPFHQTRMCVCALSDLVLCCTSRSHAQPQLAVES